MMPSGLNDSSPVELDFRASTLGKSTTECTPSFERAFDLALEIVEPEAEAAGHGRDGVLGAFPS